MVKDFQQWEFVQGYHGLYSVSNLGRVWVHGRKRIDGRFYAGKILKPFTNSGSYYVVTLWKNGERKRFLVHRLVATSFIKGGHIGDTVNHKNGKRRDNRVKNLEWCSLSYNVKDGFNRGRVIWNKGNRKMRDKYECFLCSKIFEIKRRGQIFCSRKCAARDNGLSPKKKEGLL